MSSPRDDVARPYTEYSWAHTYGAPKAVAFFPDGQRIATTGHIDLSVRIWDIKTGEEASQPLVGHHTQIPICISVSKRGEDTLIVTGGADNQVLLWTWSRLIDHLAPRVLFKGPNQFDVLSVAFSSLRSPLYVASSGTDGIVQLWKTNLNAADASSEPSLKIPFPNTQISSIQFSPSDSNVLAVTCLDKTLHIVDAHSGERKAKFSSYTTFISSLAWFPGGKRGAFSEDCGIHTFTYTSNLNGAGRARALPQVNGSGRRTLSYGSVSSGMNGHYPLSGNGKDLNELGQGKGAIIESDDPFIGHKRPINSISISPDGRFLASGSNDKTIRIWDFTSRKQVGKPIKLNSYVRIVQWYPYSQESSAVPEQQTLKLLSVTEDGEIRLWDMSYLETEESVEVTKKVSFEIRALLEKVRAEFQDTLEYELTEVRESHAREMQSMRNMLDNYRADSESRFAEVRNTLSQMQEAHEEAISSLGRTINELNEKQEAVVKQGLVKLMKKQENEFQDVKQATSDLGRKAEERQSDVQKDLKDLKGTLEQIVNQLKKAQTGTGGGGGGGGSRFGRE